MSEVLSKKTYKTLAKVFWIKDIRWNYRYYWLNNLLDLTLNWSFRCLFPHAQTRDGWYWRVQTNTQSRKINWRKLDRVRKLELIRTVFSDYWTWLHPNWATFYSFLWLILRGFQVTKESKINLFYASTKALSPPCFVQARRVRKTHKLPISSSLLKWPEITTKVGFAAFVNPLGKRRRDESGSRRYTWTRSTTTVRSQHAMSLFQRPKFS